MAGCDRAKAPTANDSTPDADQSPTFATVYPLGDILRQVGGKWVTVSWAAEEGQDVPGLLPAPSVKSAVHGAAVLVSSGFPDQWIREGLGDDYLGPRLIKPENMPSARKIVLDRGSMGGVLQGALWLDVDIVRDVVKEVRDHLSVADIQHTSDFARNADACLARLDALNKEFDVKMARLTNRRFLTTRPFWGPLVRRYSLEEIAPIDAKASTLTDAQVRALQTAAKDAGIDVLVIDTHLPPAVKHDLAERTGLRLVELDALGSSAPSGRCTYDSIIRYNLQTLYDALLMR